MRIYYWIGGERRKILLWKRRKIIWLNIIITGVFVTRDGKIFQAITDFKTGDLVPGLEIIPKETEEGYLYIADEDVKNLNKPSALVNDKVSKKKVPGKWVHHVVVYTFGDVDGSDFCEFKKGFRCVVDHLDMNKRNNSVENLQLVSFGINLFRAYYKKKNDYTERLFKTYYKSLDDIDRKILDDEIKINIEKLWGEKSA